ncbi:MAG: type II toxin-antitoxin system VapC family toxin [Actinomycetota bacterium]|nr:type II toxin-antitoxin system VapC family toxin [Actinomycetota bacterium]
MIVAYCDSRILLARLLDEPGSREADLLVSGLVDDGAALVTSQLSTVEVRRTLARVLKVAADQPLVSQTARTVLGGVRAVDVTAEVLHIAGTLPVILLRSLDAVHVATALLSEATVVVTRDRQMARTCSELGLTVA